MRSKRSQVTMLMIVGIVIFIIVSLVLYLSKSSVKKQGQQGIKKSQEISIDQQPVKEFVSKCLDKLAKDAIYTLGQQGGYLYTSQGGPIVDNLDTDEGLFFVNQNGNKVQYDIIQPRFDVTPYYSSPPNYPWLTFPYKTPDSSQEIFEGFFGINSMPALNASTGSNSIQAQIENYIDNNMAQCADLTIFKEQGYEISMNRSRTSITIGSSDVSVKSTIPMKITNSFTKETSEIDDFSANVDVRLKDIYYFAKDLISSDIKNINFNIADEGNNKDSFNVKLIKDIFSKDDLVIVADTESIVNGKPLEYVFARKNRRPTLYYIKKNSLQLEHLHLITQEDLLNGTELKAMDPDEDNYTFKITPEVPKVLDIPQIQFKIEVSDGKLSDYQIITVNEI